MCSVDLIDLSAERMKDPLCVGVLVSTWTMPWPETMQKIDEEESLDETDDTKKGIFSRAFKRHNSDLTDVVRTLDLLQQQLDEVDCDPDHCDDVVSSHRHAHDEGLSENGKSVVHASVILVKHMLNEIQGKLHLLMDENQVIGQRIDTSLQTAHLHIHQLRAELNDTHHIINKMATGSVVGVRVTSDGVSDPVAVNGDRSSPGSHNDDVIGDLDGERRPVTSERSPVSSDSESADDVTTGKDLAALSREELAALCQRLIKRRVRSRQKVRCLVAQVTGLTSAGDALQGENVQLRSRLTTCEAEILLTKEALTALKADRKRLKVEKFELLNQMKQLYQTLDDKEKGLRDFIRSYEQRIKQADESVRSLSAEREQTEREKWNILRHARDETERTARVSAELDSREDQLKQVSDQLYQLRRRLSQLGFGSDERDFATAVGVNSSDVTSPPPLCAALPAAGSCSSALSQHHQQPPGAVQSGYITAQAAGGGATASATPSGRVSSADSGVRLSSDRESLLLTGRGASARRANSGATKTASGNLSDSTTTSGEGAGSGDAGGVCYAVTSSGAVVENRRSTNYTGDYDTLSASSRLLAVHSVQEQSHPIRHLQNGGLSPAMSPPPPPPLCLPADTGAISKSAEQLDSLEPADRKWLRPRLPLTQAAWGSISRVFSRQKQRFKHSHQQQHKRSDHAADEFSWAGSWNAGGGVGGGAGSVSSAVAMSEHTYSDKLHLLEQAQQLPMERWSAAMVLAWLQVTLGMPQYGPACADCVRSGKVMLELSDAELERVLGISQVMHRRKLRLAIEELRLPHLCRFPFISQLNHVWICSEWLPTVGLAQYAETFAASLVDGRVLAHIGHKELEKHLNVTAKFHQVSLMRGVELLRMLQFDRQIISERRHHSYQQHAPEHVLIWTNSQLISWAVSIELSDYADNLKDSGVHGALIVLEPSFTAETMSQALGIPQSSVALRRHLAAELDKLVGPARAMLTDQDARGARWDRQRHLVAAGGSSTLGRSFSRSYAGGLQRNADKHDKCSSSLRGSLSRALGLRPRNSAQNRHRATNEPVYESGAGGRHFQPSASSVSVSMNGTTEDRTVSPETERSCSRSHIYAATAHYAPMSSPERPRSVRGVGGDESVGRDYPRLPPPLPSTHQQPRRSHRRIKSIGNVDSLSVTPV